ncbi:MAG: glutathione-regulated potassium-efflux system protein [Phenylobacterium sp.]|nr:glutathione-regulated potassium-efflux system protein [Phenylobacterium sp.]
MGEPLLVKTLILMAASALAVALLRRMGLPAILGYFAAGLAIGPHGLDLVAPDQATRFLAELGLIFLMFTGGLEFSLPAMLAGRGDVFGAGALQVGLTTAAAGAIAALFGAGPTAAVLTGGAVAMSSTAVVVKQLSDQGELGSSAGRLTVGMLLFQDLASLPFLVMVGAYAGGPDADPLAVARQVALGGVALVAAAVIGRPLFRGAVAWVAESRSAELLLLAVLLLALGAAWAAGLAGLAAPLGAFMAGMLVGESDLRHHAEDEIRPFRDVLMGLFFVTIGMGLDLGVAASQPLAVLAWLAAFLFVKPAIVLLVARVRRWPGEEGLRVALAFANGGEFGLLLMTQALAAGLLRATLAGPVLLALVASMGLAPVVMPLWPFIARRVRGLAPSRAPIAVAESAHDLADHVILCGCGRIGRPVAAALEASGLAYVALEKDFVRYRQARGQGLPVLFADASRLGVLTAAGLARSRLLVLTFDTARETSRILDWAKAEAPRAHRLASASDEASAAELVAQGAEVVFPENLAAGLGLADQALLLCGLDRRAAARLVTKLRAQLNPELARSGGL